MSLTPTGDVHVVKDLPEEVLQEDKGSLVPGTPFPFLPLHVGKSKKGEGEPGTRLGHTKRFTCIMPCQD